MLPSCRILTVSSSVTEARNLAELIAASNGELPEATTLSDHFESSDALRIPWIISNKYYTASVHFSLETTGDITGIDINDVPACIFVFDPLESFKPEFTSLAQKLPVADFEVSLAVSFSSNSTTKPSAQEQDALEAFFRDYGFEYVSGHYDINGSHAEHGIDDMRGVPGLSRVIDALSTILWPSMVQNPSSRRSAKSRSIIHASTEDEGLRSLLNATKDTQSVKEREMHMLEKWLEDGADDDVDPWDTSSAPPAPPSLSHNFMSGFDDNFSDFVSAPPADDSAFPSREEVQAMSEHILDMGRERGDSAEAEDVGSVFDLSRVLAGLEVMKTEIAGMKDEDERHRAAAKVALSLVYALQD